MKQTHHIGYVQTPSVKNLSNVKNALVENGLVPLATPNEMLPDAIVEGLKKLEIHDYGMIHEGKYRIRYFDIDGKILKIEYVAEGGKLTPPTKTPNYDPDYLIFDEWNYDIENYVVEQPTDVGATYKTVDDATYMLCRFSNATGLNPTLAISGFTSIDWGDGTIDTNVSHTYAKEGEYIIKIYGNTTSNTTSSKYYMGSSNLNKTVKKIYLSNKSQIKGYNFNSFGSLNTISLPTNITSIPLNCFSYNYNLYALIIPKNVLDIGYSAFINCNSLNIISIPENTTSFSNECFRYCDGLTNIIIPKTVKTWGTAVFRDCGSLKYIQMPQSLLAVPSECFYYCYALSDLEIPENVEEIQTNAFAANFALRNVFINCKTVPTLTSTNAFQNTNISLIFWVNDNIIENLKVATNWSTYADRMKPLSWYPSLTNPNEE